ncbi:hypothetical protein BDD12DRAFT_826036 [Trichophaea hybrida]|nr:hypothetical protein BDD12DRAFT_826036 [Trichophaea hybrida]
MAYMKAVKLSLLLVIRVLWDGYPLKGLVFPPFFPSFAPSFHPPPSSFAPSILPSIRIATHLSPQPRSSLIISLGCALYPSRCSTGINFIERERITISCSCCNHIIFDRLWP